MSCHQTAEWVSGNIFIRPVRLAKAGDVLPGHEHAFDHTTIVLRGTVRFQTVPPCGCEGKTKVHEVAAPGHLLIVAGVRHTAVALTDDVEFWCVYSHRHPGGDVSETATGYTEAYR